MEDLRQEFLIEAISKLENLQAELATAPFSQKLEREIFRHLHTIKGTSHTFNFNVSAKLAHEIENLLQAKRENKISETETFKAFLSEGINLLLESFQNARNKREVLLPIDFVEKLRNSIPNSSTAAPLNLTEIVPPEFLKQLSAQETEALSTAVSRGGFVYLIEVGFDFADFDERFKSLRQTLLEQGEIIANFPSTKFTAENKIGFQIFLASLKDTRAILEIIQPFGASLFNENAKENFAGDLRGVLAQAVSTCEKTAQKLSKKIEFSVSADDVKLSGEILKLISEILLHLVRNAVDHAIEKDGKIKIEISDKQNELILRVEDDGRGIDPEKIRAKAAAQKIISDDDNLSKKELLNLIFAHGFSTAERISEISGRGVGLDAVQDTVKTAGGEIRVESEKDRGTIFEIVLPKQLEEK